MRVVSQETGLSLGTVAPRRLSSLSHPSNGTKLAFQVQGRGAQHQDTTPGHATWPTRVLRLYLCRYSSSLLLMCSPLPTSLNKNIHPRNALFLPPQNRTRLRRLLELEDFFSTLLLSLSFPFFFHRDLTLRQTNEVIKEDIRSRNCSCSTINSWRRRFIRIRYRFLENETTERTFSIHPTRLCFIFML